MPFTGFLNSNAAGSAIGGASGLLGSLFSGIFAKRQAKRQNQFAREMYNAEMAYNTSEREAAQAYNSSEREAAQLYNTSEREAQNDWNFQMWQKQNEYDSPSAQRERLIQAGYNPLMMGDFSAQSSSIASSSPASVDGASIGSHGVSAPDLVADTFAFSPSEAVNIMREFANVGLTEAQTRKTYEESLAIPQFVFNDSERASAEAEFKRYSSQILLAQLPYAGKVKKWEVELEKVQKRYFESLIDVQNETKKQLEYETSRLPEITDAKINNMKSQTAYYNQLVNESVTLLPLRYQEIISEIAQNYSQSSLNNANAQNAIDQHEIFEKYGEEEAQAALQAYHDAHVNAQTDLVIKTLGFKQDVRANISGALQLLDFRSTGELADYLKFLKDIKDKSYVAPGKPEHWYDAAGPILGIAASGVVAYMLRGRGVVGASASRSYYPPSATGGLFSVPILK